MPTVEPKTQAKRKRDVEALESLLIELGKEVSRRLRYDPRISDFP